MALEFPIIDPIALQLGPFAIRWYALAYLAGIFGGWHYMNKLVDRYSYDRPNKEDIENFISLAVMGIVVGGRAGYVLFYNWSYYKFNLIETLYIWEGGMSFHGGMLGVFLAIFFFSKMNNIPLFLLSDYVTAAAPIGLFFGRIANFINGELYGRVTDATWGMVFPHAGEYPRHPSQLYEAALEGLLLFIILGVIIRTKFAQKYNGFVSGCFLAGYGISRFVIEFYRQPDTHIGLLDTGLSMGQSLSLPMITLGVLIMLYTAYFQPKKEGS